ncbi:hypothetical protein RhiirA5_403248 [Rhizophagus irregularis]|uniref:Uncharacterized protein n=1 Tax=Rhizophagus irregularis TaxID=588596 RepID=A0A2N0P0R5_9GLOM|nr:hypothetical protein RhiirA5_403248 [Rhizophagus irregularis]
MRHKECEFWSRVRQIINKPVDKPSTPPSPFEPSDNIQIPPNATAQKHSFATLQKTKTDLYEFNKIFQMATSSELRSQFNSKIKKLEETIVVEKRLKQLKNHATSKQRTRKRKSFFMNDPEKMNSSIEFGTVDYKYHKEVIKKHTKAMHPSRRERTTQLIEKECNRQFIEDKCEGVEDERVNIW